MASHLPFRRHANDYERHNLVQKKIARRLADGIAKPHDTIVELGCGNGTFFKVYPHPFRRYVAIDAAPEMVALHPQTTGVENWVGDFNDPSLFERIRAVRPDLIVSASALQWAEDLDRTLAMIAELDRPVALAIFTAGTFASLRKITGAPSPIRDFDTTAALLRKYWHGPIEPLRYRLYFSDRLAMLRYIKYSGVTGGGRPLPYRTVKRILAAYPFAYLEMEALRFYSSSKH
jgi:malonyl-CoA O-methyltransferase